jgi:hypothetical protein
MGFSFGGTVTGEERRRSPRYPVDAPARVAAGGQTVEGRLRDLCRDAAFVETDRPFPLHSEVELDMVLDAEKPLRLRGTVIRLGVSEYGGSGMAVLFSDLTPESIFQIDVYISARETRG